MTSQTETLTKSKQILGEKIPCSVEILSPVHVGSGVRLVERWDFIYTRDTNLLKIVSQEELLPTLSEKQINEFNDDDKRYNILLRSKSERIYKLDYHRGEVLEFERNGNGNPYIPGSSLKGTIRTAIFVSEYAKQKQDYDKLLEEIVKEKEKAKSQWASTPILNKCFGEDPNHNFMRLLTVSDVYFSQNAVEVSEVKILSLSNKEATSFNYKNFSLYPEHLKIGAKGNFTIKIDKFLLENEQAKQQLKFPKLTIENIAELINAQSKRHLEKEIAFFKKCGKDSLKNVIEFNEFLLANIPESNTEFVLRLSWGSGWKGMTGDYLDENWLKAFREKFKLGKNGFPIFPKTRRILFRDNKPIFTLGWIKVRLNHLFTNDELQNTKSSISELESPANPKKTQPKPQGAVEAIVVSMDKPKAKVEILEGKYKNVLAELNMPVENLKNLGVEKDKKIYVNIIEQNKKIQSVQFRGLKT